MLDFEFVEVECYSGYKAEESPRAFMLRGQRAEITEILDRWYEAGLKAETGRVDYFKVRTRDGTQYILGHSHLMDRWAILLSSSSNTSPHEDPP